MKEIEKINWNFYEIIPFFEKNNEKYLSNVRRSVI